MAQELGQAHDLRRSVQALQRAVEVVRMAGRLDGPEVRLEIADLWLEQPRVEGRREPVVVRSSRPRVVEERRSADAQAPRLERLPGGALAIRPDLDDPLRAVLRDQDREQRPAKLLDPVPEGARI